MKKYLLSFVALAALIASAVSVSASTPEQEKAFVDGYKAAFEAKDAAKLQSFLYTTGADAQALEFYKMMMTTDMGSKVSKIELRKLTPEETKKAAEVMPGPSGNMKLPLTPTLKLVIGVETKNANGSSTSTSESFVAESGGKLVIPVPVAAK
ncbi:MAG TPA: hypothetical protein VFX30_09845 [bacterium]|nr:hypothetical protein [bacterium]